MDPHPSHSARKNASHVSMEEDGHTKLRIHFRTCSLAVVEAINDLNLTIVDDDAEDYDVCWMDSKVPDEKYSQLKPHQIINHIPGLKLFGHKDSFAQHIRKMQTFWREEFDIIPRTWIIPPESESLSRAMEEQGGVYIVKPAIGSQGKGIKLVQSPDQIPQEENLIAQEYIDKPLLMDGFKFDLRLYVLVVSCFPLRAFLYNDGLVRLSTLPYSSPSDSNMVHVHDKLFMHLTNYSINREHELFVASDSIDTGSKRTVKFLFSNWLVDKGYDGGQLWRDIEDVVVKTLIAGHHSVKLAYEKNRPGSFTENGYNQSFQILGVDMLVDENLKPWMLEINSAPSFSSVFGQSQLDFTLKRGIVRDALNLVLKRPGGTQNIVSASEKCLPFGPVFQTNCDGLSPLEQVRLRLNWLTREKQLLKHEDRYMGGYTRIFPSSDAQRQHLYMTMLEHVNADFTSERTASIRKWTVDGIESMDEDELSQLLSRYEQDKNSPYSSQTGAVISSN